MDGYYDYGPQIDLSGHLLLAGFITEETRTLGYRLAALNGLPFADLDRKIEHRSGMSIWKLIWSEGLERYRELESEILRQELAARPFGVLTVGDGALIDDDLRRHALRHATAVFLELDLPNCYWRLKNRADAHDGHWHPLFSAPLEHIDQVRPFFQQRKPGLGALPHSIPLHGHRGSEVLDGLSALLPTPRTAGAAGAGRAEETPVKS